MDLKLLIHTLIHLKLTQIWYQIRYRLHRPKYVELKCVGESDTACLAPIDKPVCLKGKVFTFLNISSPFTSWNETRHGMLWAYNLNYMDWLCQEGMDAETGAAWIDRFVDELPENRVGLDPYPIALRGINWIKFIAKHGKEMSAERLARWNDSLYSQYVLLSKKLEFHLLGNHLLEDAYSLFIAALYFSDAKFYGKVVPLLRRELAEQVMADGSHYEQSPMYHCSLLDRLLDCYNFSVHNQRFDSQKEMNAFLKDVAERMLGHLESIVYENGDIPLLNDAAVGIAPTAAQLRDYAQRIGLDWQPIALGDCGYRKWKVGVMELVMDVGGITATYQPGHTHADSFNYELRIDGIPVVVDTGISTYNKTGRRQYERSTKAHNCVAVKNQNSDEVWDGFRVGRHCKVTVTCDEKNHVEVYHNGFEKKCYRSFTLKDGDFTIEDNYDGEAISYIHLASGVDPDRVEITGANSVEILDTKYSVEYNRFIENKTIAIHFVGACKYSIKYK